ncbi:MAG TPA: saccharopine dehydrogenase C-terminal domain-containing protein [Puia sp.]|nr:saccharopine dehydrogenase C-terminal domain-containing protein [Puia sp.]
MKKILLFGAGKSATCLIRYLIRETALRGWQLVVAENNLVLAQSKIGNAPRATAVALQVEDEPERENLIREADIVISLLPPALHFLVAVSCVKWSKDLLTASYLDDNLKALEPALLEKGLLFIGEMGLDPGIDHMSAMQLIHRIRQKKGRVHSFRSHTGGLIAPESDNNPWHYKISWNPRNVVLAGSAGARYKENAQIVTRGYADLFGNCEEVAIDGIKKNLSWYPNRDSLSYIPVYGLEEAETFIRTTLRYPGFCQGWKNIVQAGLTDDKTRLPGTEDHPGKSDATADPLTVAAWSAPILPFVNADNREQLEFLGLFDKTPIPAGAQVSADILQHLLETRLAMEPQDKDMIVMLHEIAYTVNGVPHQETSSLIVIGEDPLHTAMAKTVGLPLGIAAKLILEGKMQGLTGLHIPILPEIYEPVLAELAEEGIRFVENTF